MTHIHVSIYYILVLRVPIANTYPSKTQAEPRKGREGERGSPPLGTLALFDPRDNPLILPMYTPRHPAPRLPCFCCMSECQTCSHFGKSLKLSYCILQETGRCRRDGAPPGGTCCRPVQGRMDEVPMFRVPGVQEIRETGATAGRRTLRLRPQRIFARIW